MKNYGILNLTVSSPPQSFVEPFTLAEAKAFLELPERSPTDEAEDAMVEGFITAARFQAEIAQNRDLVAKQYDLSLDYFTYLPSITAQYTTAGGEIKLRTPLVSVDLVTYKDSDGNTTTLAEDTDYIVDLARGIMLPPYNTSWPIFVAWPSSAVLVRFTSGILPDDPFWSDSGAAVKIGMKYLISHWFAGRLPFETGGQVIAEYPYTVTQCLSAGAVPRVR